jgi:uncharacterized protein (UPF0335 family)
MAGYNGNGRNLSDREPEQELNPASKGKMLAAIEAERMALEEKNKGYGLGNFQRDATLAVGGAILDAGYGVAQKGMEASPHINKFFSKAGLDAKYAMGFLSPEEYDEQLKQVIAMREIEKMGVDSWKRGAGELTDMMQEAREGFGIGDPTMVEDFIRAAAPAVVGGTMGASRMVGSKLLNPKNTTGIKRALDFTGGIVGGFVGDFASTHTARSHENTKGLGNVVEDKLGWENIFAIDEGDSGWETSFKRAGEGALIGGAAEGVMRAIGAGSRSVKASRLKAAVEAENAAAKNMEDFPDMAGPTAVDDLFPEEIIADMPPQAMPAPTIKRPMPPQAMPAPTAKPMSLRLLPAPEVNPDGSLVAREGAPINIRPDMVSEPQVVSPSDLRTNPAPGVKAVIDDVVATTDPIPAPRADAESPTKKRVAFKNVEKIQIPDSNRVAVRAADMPSTKVGASAILKSYDFSRPIVSDNYISDGAMVFRKDAAPDLASAFEGSSKKMARQDGEMEGAFGGDADVSVEWIGGSSLTRNADRIQSYSMIGRTPDGQLVSMNRNYKQYIDQNGMEARYFSKEDGAGKFMVYKGDQQVGMVLPVRIESLEAIAAKIETPTAAKVEAAPSPKSNAPKAKAIAPKTAAEMKAEMSDVQRNAHWNGLDQPINRAVVKANYSPESEAIRDLAVEDLYRLAAENNGKGIVDRKPIKEKIKARSEQAIKDIEALGVPDAKKAPAKKAPAKKAPAKKETKTAAPKKDEALSAKAVTAKDIKNADDLIKRLTTRAREIGGDDFSLSFVRGLVDGKGEASFNRAARVMKVSLDADDPMAALDHEIVHALWKGLSKADRGALERAGKTWIKKYGIDKHEHYSKLSQVEQLEEAVAHHMAAITRGDIKPAGAMQRIYDTIKNGLERVRSLLNNEGFQSSDDVMKKIRNGEMKGKVDAPKAVNAPKGALDSTSTLAYSMPPKGGLGSGKGHLNKAYGRDVEGLFEIGRTVSTKFASAVDAVKKIKANPAGARASVKDLSLAMTSHARSGVFFSQASNTYARIRKAAYHNRPTETLEKLQRKLVKVRDGKISRETYNETVTKMNGRVNKAFETAMKPFETKADLESRLIIRDILVETDGKLAAKYADTEIGESAKILRKMLKELVKSARKEGMEIGSVENYFPRIFDMDKAIKNPEDFKKAAREYFTAHRPENAKTAKDIEGYVDDLYSTMWSGKHGYAVGDNPLTAFKAKNGATQHAKPRRLGPEADMFFKEFLETDPMVVLPKYANAIAEKAAWEKHFPDAEMKELFEQLVNEGNEEFLDEIQKEILSSTGNRKGWGADSAVVRNVVSALQTLASVALLPHTVITSLSEPLLLFVRSNWAGDGQSFMGNVKDLHKNFSEAYKGVDSTSEAREMARYLGLIMGDMADSVLAARMGGGLDTGWSQKITNTFFRASMLSQWTDANRVMAVKGARRSIDLSIKKAIEKGDKHIIKDLAAMGIGKEHLAELKKLLDNADVDEYDEKFISWEQLDEAKDIGEVYGNAVRRFTEDVIVSPTAVDRPRLATHPIFKPVYGLTAYMFGFQGRVMNPNLKRAAEGAGRIKKNAKAVKAGEMTGNEAAMDVLRDMGPLLALLTIMPAAQAGATEIRSKLVGSKGYDDMETAAYIQLIASRAGLLGSLDYPINVLTGVRYEKDIATALSGPAPSVVLDIVKNGYVGITNARKAAKEGKDGTSAKRMVADAAFDMLKPIVNTSISSFYPIGGRVMQGATMIGVQGVSRKSTQEGFVNYFGGEKKERGKKETLRW